MRGRAAVCMLFNAWRFRLGVCVPGAYMHVCSRGRAAACILFKAFHFRLGVRVLIRMHVRVAGLLYACCLRRGTSVYVNVQRLPGLPKTICCDS